MLGNSCRMIKAIVRHLASMNTALIPVVSAGLQSLVFRF